jgi:hypothetical protein
VYSPTRWSGVGTSGRKDQQSWNLWAATGVDLEADIDAVRLGVPGEPLGVGHAFVTGGLLGLCHGTLDAVGHEDVHAVDLELTADSLDRFGAHHTPRSCWSTAELHRRRDATVAHDAPPGPTFGVSASHFRH